MFCKIPVPLIPARHRHHRTSTITGQYIITYPDRDGLFSKRMLSISPGKCSRNGLDISHTLALATFSRRLYIRINLRFLLRCGNLLYQVQLRRQGHKGHSKNGVGTGGEDFNPPNPQRGNKRI